MVMKMNKNEFVKELLKQTGYDEEKCNIINDVLEDSFILGKNNKEKIIAKFENDLKCDENEANKIYETVMDIFSNEIKNKIKHQFKNQD